MRKSRLVMAVFMAMIGCVAAKAQQTVLSLNSSNKAIHWEIKPQADVKAGGLEISKPGYKMGDYVEGVVPGVVFTAYVNAGKEKNPDYSDNIYNVDETKYNRPFWYRMEFELPSKLQAGQHVWLNFDNTNRFADFYFNGHKISGTKDSKKDVSGHMLRSKFDVTQYVNNGGKNAIAVLIYDPDQKKTRTDKGPYGVACSPSYLAAAGWDWMPYVPGRLAGITGNAYVTVTGDAVLRDPWVRSYLPSLDKAELQVQSMVKNVGSAEKTITLSGTITPGNIHFSKTARVKAGDSATIHIDKDDVKSLVVNNPRLWWPNGYGDPNLYQCKVECSVDGKVSDTQTFNFGIRKYEYRFEKNAMDYPVLNIYVNGQRIFVKGGNWGMSEYLLRCHGKDYEPKIRLHKEMNYNMIRLWTGCVTDDEFYDYCDKYGIMVWNDFWLYVAFNDVVQHDAFKINARDKVRRLRNHACIAVWCGANETHPVADIDQALRMIVMEDDGNDRLYTSCSNQDAKSGSGWWKDMPPRHHFETSASNLAFNKPSYPYGFNYGYGFRSEIGMATFPTYESLRLFIPEKDQWPLPTDEQLKDDDSTIYNRHFFGKEAWNGGPIDYKNSVNDRYGESKGIEEFCEKAQLINLEDMKGMYEAWNDKMWNDASAILIWMSHPAYPSFVWQTYDYYYDPTGCYWGAKQACEPRHIQWNCLTNNVKVINATSEELQGAKASATVYDMNGKQLYTCEATVNVRKSNIASAFDIDFKSINSSTAIQFIRLKLTDASGKLISENFYWRNGEKDLDYRDLLKLPETNVKATIENLNKAEGKFTVVLENKSNTVSFANRVRLVNRKTGERILPAIMSDGYVTLLPGESRAITVEVEPEMLSQGAKVLVKTFNKKEKALAKI